MKRKSLPIAVIILSCLCLSSCVQINPVTPIDYSNLLLKINDLFILCGTLVSQNTLTGSGQAIARMYYAFYHLARLYNINTYNKEQGGHKKTWDKITDPNIKKFGLALKDLREKYDYDPIDPLKGQGIVATDFADIVSYEKSADALIDKVERTLPKCHCLSLKNISDFQNAISDIRKSKSKFFDELKIRVSIKGSSSPSTPPACGGTLWMR